MGWKGEWTQETAPSYSSQVTHLNTNSMLYTEWEVGGMHDPLKCDCIETQHVIEVLADISDGRRIALLISHSHWLEYFHMIRMTKEYLNQSMEARREKPI